MATRDEILAQVNIVDVIGETVALEKRGKNHTGLCPFHDEKTPSFSVSEEKQLYHCFGCKASGNAITFLKETRGISGSEALKLLAERAGLEYQVKERPHQRLLDALKAAKDVYHVLLTNSKKGEPALAYLKNRQIDEKTIQAFDLGIALKGRDHLLNALVQKSFLLSELSDAGLVTGEAKPTDFFSGRLMIPIKDIHGMVRGFSGRLLGDGDPKYLNSAENVVFAKNELLYGLYEAKPAIQKANRVLITEGYFDVFRAHQMGVSETVGLMGTTLSRSHIQMLSRLTQRFYLVLDGDQAGRAAAEKMLPVLSGLDVHMVELPEGADLDSFLLDKGLKGLEAALKNAKDPTAFIFDGLKATYDLSKIGEFERFKKSFYPVLKKESITVQSFYIKTLSEATGIGVAVLTQDFNGLKKPTPSIVQQTSPVMDKYKKAEIQILHYFLYQEFYSRWFRREFQDIMYINPMVRDIQFEIFEHYDLNPVSCLVYPLFKASLSPAQQQFLDDHIDMDHYPFNADEFDDLLNVLKQFTVKEKMTRLKTALLEAQSLDEKVQLREQMDALKKELTHGI